MARPTTYFPALDALRATAMLLVLTGHFSVLGNRWGIGSMAGQGLSLFFVLSGFLITYLLLLEKEERGRIDIPRFYMRRVLRIWPMYYVVVCLALFVVPYTGVLGYPEIDGDIRNHFHEMAPWYLLFLPNVPRIFRTPVNPYIHITWSIGVEEQFYLVWPWIVRRLRRHWVVLLYLLILAGFLANYAYYFVFDDLKLGERSAFWRFLSQLNTFVYYSNIGYFALGGLMAFYRLKRPRFARILAAKAVQWIVLLLCAVLVVKKPFFAGELVLGICFSLLILHATQEGTLVARWKNPVFLYLGKISYSMYLFHVMALLAAIKIVALAGRGHWPPVVTGPAEFLLGFGFTVLAGAVSYRYVESFFLRIKKKLDPLRSRHAVAETMPIS